MAIGRPLQFRHIIQGSTCSAEFFALGLTDRLGGQNNTAVIVRCVLDLGPRECNHWSGGPRMGLEARTQRHWDRRAVAKLDGYKDGSSTLGNILSISPNETRIAMSNWTQLLVWTLDHTTLSTFYANVDTEDPRVQFPPDDICQDSGLVVLRPVQLSSHGIIHSLGWQDDTRLLAITDRGLVRWDVGPLAQGKAHAVSTMLEDRWASGSPLTEEMRESPNGPSTPSPTQPRRVLRKSEVFPFERCAGTDP